MKNMSAEPSNFITIDVECNCWGGGTLVGDRFKSFTGTLNRYGICDSGGCLGGPPGLGSCPPASRNLTWDSDGNGGGTVSVGGGYFWWVYDDTGTLINHCPYCSTSTTSIGYYPAHDCRISNWLN